MAKQGSSRWDDIEQSTRIFWDVWIFDVRLRQTCFLYTRRLPGSCIAEIGHSGTHKAYNFARWLFRLRSSIVLGRQMSSDFLNHELKNTTPSGPSHFGLHG
jgi:hypothetical protein